MVFFVGVDVEARPGGLPAGVWLELAPLNRLLRLLPLPGFPKRLPGFGVGVVELPNVKELSFAPKSPPEVTVLVGVVAAAVVIGVEVVFPNRLVD